MPPGGIRQDDPSETNGRWCQVIKPVGGSVRPPRKRGTACPESRERHRCDRQTSAIIFDYNDGTLTIWETSSETRKRTFPSHQYEGSWRDVSFHDVAVVFSNDTRFVVAKYESNPTRFWEVSSNTLVHTIVDDDVAQSLSFSDNGAYPLTNRRSYYINFDEETGLVSSSPVEGQLEITRQWIRRGGRDVLWIPPAYRPEDLHRTAVRDNYVAIRHSSGRVFIIEFNTQSEVDLGFGDGAVLTMSQWDQFEIATSTK